MSIRVLSRSVFISLLLVFTTTAVADYSVASLQERARSGDTGAQYQLAVAYQLGDGLKKDMAKAVSWYKRAAENGHDQARTELGILYYEGRLIDQNVKRAYELLSVSARNGIVQAQYYLGNMYESGQGASADMKKAMHWYQRSEIGGYEMAANAIERIEREQEKERLARLKPKPKLVRTQAKAAPEPTVQEKILSMRWGRNSQGAEYLPSDISACKMRSDETIICNSEKQKLRIPGVEGEYRTRAILHGFEKNGEFSVIYRNLVTRVKELSPDEQPSRVSKGWQDTEHHLVCRLQNNKDIQCVKNKTMQLGFKAVSPGKVVKGRDGRILSSKTDISRK